MLEIHFKLVRRKKDNGVNIHLVSIDRPALEGPPTEYHNVKCDLKEFLSEPVLGTYDSNKKKDWRPKIEDRILKYLGFYFIDDNFPKQLEIITDIKDALKKYHVELTEVPYKLLIHTEKGDTIWVTNH